MGQRDQSMPIAVHPRQRLTVTADGGHTPDGERPPWQGRETSDAVIMAASAMMFAQPPAQQSLGMPCCVVWIIGGDISWMAQSDREDSILPSRVRAERPKLIPAKGAHMWGRDGCMCIP